MVTEIASIVLSGVLIFVTGYYAWESRNQRKELEKQREFEVKPVLKPVITHKFGIHWRLAIRNVGKGDALDIEASWDLD